MNVEQWARDIMDHAATNWGKQGWDYIYECWTVEEIAAEITKCKTYSGALRKIAAIAKCYALRQTEIDSEIY
jgi:hypothetical protein